MYAYLIKPKITLRKNQTQPFGKWSFHPLMGIVEKIQYSKSKKHYTDQILKQINDHQLISIQVSPEENLIAHSQMLTASDSSPKFVAEPENK